MTGMDGIDPAIAEAGRRATAFSMASARSLDPGSWVEASADEIRAAYDASSAYWNSDPPPVALVLGLTLPGPHGSLRVRIYRSRDDSALPGLLWLHGGGFMLGSIETHDSLCRLLAREADAAGSIERLPPRRR